jgi:hypothetical protein
MASLRYVMSGQLWIAGLQPSCPNLSLSKVQLGVAWNQARLVIGPLSGVSWMLGSPLKKSQLMTQVFALEKHCGRYTLQAMGELGTARCGSLKIGTFDANLEARLWAVLSSDLFLRALSVRPPTTSLDRSHLHV